jgi:hypothetical protein
MAQRQANAEAQAAGRPLPYPNPWDGLMPKLPPGAGPRECRQWVREFADRCEPRGR